MSRYNFYIDEKNRKVICTSHYAGQVVKGTAKCHPSDKFNFEIGKALAQKRCDVKVLGRRLNGLMVKADRIIDEIEVLEKRLEKTRSYATETANQYIELCDELRLN